MPLGFNDEDKKAMIEFFNKYFNKYGQSYLTLKKKDRRYVDQEDHSQVIYLMNKKNRCIGFYDLNIEESSFYESILDDISFDLKQVHEDQKE